MVPSLLVAPPPYGAQAIPPGSVPYPISDFNGADVSVDRSEQGTNKEKEIHVLGE
jgi:hypothetical protein